MIFSKVEMNYDYSIKVQYLCQTNIYKVLQITKCQINKYYSVNTI